MWRTVFSGGADPLLFRGSEGSLIYVSQGPAYVVWSGIPSWVLIGSNHRCSSVMETHFSIHHRSLITRTRIRLEKMLDMKFHDLNTDRLMIL